MGEGGEVARLGRSRYERVLINAVSGRRLDLFGEPCTPVAMRGWSRVVFRRDVAGGTYTVPVDALVERLADWER